MKISDVSIRYMKTFLKDDITCLVSCWVEDEEIVQSEFRKFVDDLDRIRQAKTFEDIHAIIYEYHEWTKEEYAQEIIKSYQRNFNDLSFKKGVM